MTKSLSQYLDEFRACEWERAMSTTHAPGPWRYVADLGVHVIRQQRTDGEFDGYIATTWGGPNEHDARLIAAAPELLAALCMWMDADPATEGDRVRASRAAIAKATGEQQ